MFIMSKLARCRQVDGDSLTGHVENYANESITKCKPTLST